MRTLLVASALAGALVLAACDDEEGGGGEVEIGLQEWSVNPNLNSIESGEVVFNIENRGPDHEHELVIIRTDIPPEELPTKDDGSVDEEADGVEVVGEIPEVAPGEEGSGTFTLDPGKYALICNIVDEEEGEEFIHYQQGMWTPFTVE